LDVVVVPCGRKLDNGYMDELILGHQRFKKIFIYCKTAKSRILCKEFKAKYKL